MKWFSSFHLTPFIGVVIVVYGHERDDGKFQVEDFCTADLPVQIPRTNLDQDR